MTSKESISGENASERTGNGFKPIIDKVYVEGAYALIIVPLERFEVNGASPTVGGGFQEPIILDGRFTDSRLREDNPEPSPLTPQEVAKYLSPNKDTKMGMPQVPRQPGLYPWEGVLYQ